MKSITFSLIFILIVFSLNVWALSVDDVAREFVCNCGCGKMLDACEMKGCAGAMKELIREKIDAGWSKERIVEYFVRMYGETILAAPTKRGFNLTAWITPFLAIAVGGLIIYLVILEWVKVRRKGDGGGKFERRVEREVESEYGRKLEKELKEFDQ